MKFTFRFTRQSEISSSIRPFIIKFINRQVPYLTTLSAYTKSHLWHATMSRNQILCFKIQNKTEYDKKSDRAQMNINQSDYPKYTNTKQFPSPSTRIDQLHSPVCLSTCNLKTIHQLQNTGHIRHSIVLTQQNTNRELTKYSVLICIIDDSILFIKYLPRNCGQTRKIQMVT